MPTPRLPTLRAVVCGLSVLADQWTLYSCTAPVPQYRPARATLGRPRPSRLDSAPPAITRYKPAIVAAKPPVTSQVKSSQVKSSQVKSSQVNEPPVTSHDPELCQEAPTPPPTRQPSRTRNRNANGNGTPSSSTALGSTLSSPAPATRAPPTRPTGPCTPRVDEL